MIFVALAILEQDGRFLMQLRDDIPTILYPGVWGLFGGHLEAGESPEIGLKRELKEEINYEARQGEYYSEKINQTRSLGKIHRQILLDFLEVEL